MNWWNHIPEHINPNIIEIRSLQIRYYGVMYLVAFTITYLLVLHRLKNEGYEYPKAVVQKYFVWAILGLLIGGKLGFILFYDLMYFITHPLRIFNPFGMSYHGGLLGVILATLFFCYKNRVDFWHFADLLTPAIPLGYTFGRIGNFGRAGVKKHNAEKQSQHKGQIFTFHYALSEPPQLAHGSAGYPLFFQADNPPANIETFLCPRCTSFRASFSS